MASLHSHSWDGEKYFLLWDGEKHFLLGKRAMMKMKRVLRYPRGTSELPITYESSRDDGNHELVGYLDADHAGDSDEG